VSETLEELDEAVFITTQAKRDKKKLAGRIFAAITQDMDRHPDEHQGGVYVCAE
jgi:hypothetical protein